MPPIRVLPSLLSADFGRLAEELAACQAAGASIVHVDVMDAHFVPNLTLGPFIVEAMRRHTTLTLDVHLMMTDPIRYAPAFRQAGADHITFHVEAVGPRDIDQAIASVRDLGCQVGLAFNPDTTPNLWWDAIAQVDQVMLMTVYPGFGGQRFIDAVRPAIRAVRERFPDLPIAVDGGINRATAPQVIADGANWLVMGSAYFKDADPTELVCTLESTVATDSAR